MARRSRNVAMTRKVDGKRRKIKRGDIARRGMNIFFSNNLLHCSICMEICGYSVSATGFGKTEDGRKLKPGCGAWETIMTTMCYKRKRKHGRDV